MKRVSVVTWVGNGNYGTTLQSFALCKFLEKYGYDVTLLQQVTGKDSIKSLTKALLSTFGLFKLREWKSFQKSRSLQKLYCFIKVEYRIVSCYTRLTTKRYIKQIDTFVTGSDQIWNAWYAYTPFYFLDFPQNKKRVAYASSIGTSDFPPQYKDSIKEFLQRFSHIGVREKTAVRAIENLTRRNDIRQVLDPTFLLTGKDWSEMASTAEIELELPKEYILVYLIGERAEYAKQVQCVKNALGINNVIIIPSAENSGFCMESDSVVYKNAGPREFVKLIQNARFVCTDSFHATAISINMSVDFVTLSRFDDSDKESQNSRIYDLLDLFNLSQRMFDKNALDWKERIDYHKTQEQLTIERNRSLDFLIKALEE